MQKNYINVYFTHFIEKSTFNYESFGVDADRQPIEYRWHDEAAKERIFYRMLRYCPNFHCLTLEVNSCD